MTTALTMIRVIPTTNAIRPPIAHSWSISILLALAMMLASAAPGALASQTWLVGPERKLKTPSAAAQVAAHGDTVEIDAATYVNDYAVWHQDNLTLRGAGGMARLHSNGLIPNGKGIWIINGNNTVIENLAFSGAAVQATNGAGIRHQGGDLTLRNTYFHHNEFSVLTGPNPKANIAVFDSRFWHQQRPARFSHGIYIGTVGSFTISGSHFQGTDQGHQIKSRALENRILYNRIEDGDSGNSSRLIDLPNCGFSIIMGNDMQQGSYTSNTDAIGYGAELCPGRDERQRTLYVINNTLINEAPAATLARNHHGSHVIMLNNLIYGRGQFLAGKGTLKGNLRLPLQTLRAGPENTMRSWQPGPGSAAIDAAAAPPADDQALVPNREFLAPTGTTPRRRAGPLDIGAREYAGEGVRGED